MKPLGIVGSIDIPKGIEWHPHMLEAQAAAMVMEKRGIERVVGTDNRGEYSQRVQLYGWGRDVDCHADRTGWIYFAPLVLGKSIVFASCAPARGWHRRRLQRGHVYRLNDFIEHWTADTQPVVCAFLGPFKEPGKPLEAVATLQAGIHALKRSIHDAPRVSPGFRIPLRGEVYALLGDHGAIVPLMEARKQGHIIARCGLCQHFAIKLDRLFPYHAEENRCRQHVLDDVERPELQELAA